MEFTVCIILSWVSFVQHYVNKIHPDVLKVASSFSLFLVFHSMKNLFIWKCYSNYLF